MTIVVAPPYSNSVNLGTFLVPPQPSLHVIFISVLWSKTPPTLVPFIESHRGSLGRSPPTYSFQCQTSSKWTGLRSQGLSSFLDLATTRVVTSPSVNSRRTVRHPRFQSFHPMGTMRGREILLLADRPRCRVPRILVTGDTERGPDQPTEWVNVNMRGSMIFF